jgi:hypothetical protein
MESTPATFLNTGSLTYTIRSAHELSSGRGLVSSNTNNTLIGLTELASPPVRISHISLQNTSTNPPQWLKP